MKKILNSRRHHYVARVTIFLVMVALVVVTIGCDPIFYELTIGSTAGGWVTTPGEGTFPYYYMGQTVNLVAESEEDYKFVRWTGDVKTIDDVHAAETTITMNGDYSITASFKEIPPPVNWPLVGGVIAAVVAAGLLIFFMRRRKLL